MKASQVLLNELGIALPQVPNGANPQQVFNDFAGAFLYAYQAMQAGTYKSPANLPLPSSLPEFALTPEQLAAGVTLQEAIAQLATDPWSQFSPAVVAAQSAAVSHYYSLLASGNLAAIHAALDAINALAPLTKQPIIDTYPDLRLLQNAPGIVGQVAQGFGVEYFPYGPDPIADQIIQSALAGDGPAVMQPTRFPL